MTTDEAVEHFGGVKELARTLGVWPQVIYKWGDYPPMGRQYEIQVRSGGVLTAEQKAASNG